MHKSLIMKKVLLFLLLFFASGLLKAQFNYNKYNYYSLGVHLGPDFYNYSFDKAKKLTESPQFNYSFGVSGAYYYNWLIEFHGSVNFSSRNLSLNWSFPDSSDALKNSYYVLRYINIPLEITVNALYLDWMKLNFGVGVMPDFRIRPREFLTYNNGQVSESVKYWNSKKFTSVLVAFPLSMNLKFYINRHYTIQLSAVYLIYANEMHREYMTKSATAINSRLGVYYEW